jgi:hypothetical protein
MENFICKIDKIGFKGERKYLHGTDIFNTLLEGNDSFQKINMQFHKSCRNKLIAKSVSVSEFNEMREKGEICVLFTCILLNKKLLIVLLETEEEVIDRTPYDESKITGGSVIKGSIITQNKPVEGNFIERVVALNKALLTHYTGENNWFFSKIDLAKFPSSYNNLSLEVVRELGGRIYQSILKSDNNKLGTVYFSKDSL